MGAHGESSRGRLLEAASAAGEADLHGAHPQLRAKPIYRAQIELRVRTLAGPFDVLPLQPEWHTGRRKPRRSIPLSRLARAWR